MRGRGHRFARTACPVRRADQDTALWHASLLCPWLSNCLGACVGSHQLSSVTPALRLCAWMLLASHGLTHPPPPTHTLVALHSPPTQATTARAIPTSQRSALSAPSTLCLASQLPLLAPHALRARTETHAAQRPAPAAVRTVGTRTVPHLEQRLHALGAALYSTDPRRICGGFASVSCDTRLATSLLPSWHVECVRGCHLHRHVCPMPTWLLWQCARQGSMRLMPRRHLPGSARSGGVHTMRRWHLQLCDRRHVERHVRSMPCRPPERCVWISGAV